MSQLKGKLFDDPNIQYPNYQNLPFSEYIHISRNIIAKNRLDLNQNNQYIIEANAPFELTPENPNQQGVLLVHGLFDSPFILQDIGKKLAEAGFLVRAILLPGHGTVPGALLNVTNADWLAAVQYGVETLKKDVAKVHILGFSLGGALSLMQPNLASYTLLAPVFKIRSMFAGTANGYRAFSWISKRAAWFYTDPEETLDYVKYRSVPFNAVYQVYSLTKMLPKIHLNRPSYFVVPKNDMTVCSKATIRYFKKNANEKSHMILYAPNHLAEGDPRILIKKSIYPDRHITDFSHPCIPISPDNKHYGEQGDFPYASHLPTHENIEYGEYSALRLKMNQLALQCRLTRCKQQRLSYNPDFEVFSRQIIQFIQSI